MSFKLGGELLSYPANQGRKPEPAGARGSGILMAMQTELEREVLRVTLKGKANLNASVRLINQAFGITTEKRVFKLLCKKYF
jgi:hypothetical protein